MIAMHNDLKPLIHYSPGGVLSKVVIKSERLNVTLFSMAAGTDIGEHTSTKEATVHVIEGEGTFTLSGKAIAMRPGVLIHMRPSEKHAIAAEKDLSFLLTLVGP